MLVHVAGGVRDRQVAARRDGVDQRAHDRDGVVLVGDELEDHDQADRDGAAEVQQVRRVLEDLPGIPDVGVDVGAGTLGGAGTRVTVTTGR